MTIEKTINWIAIILIPLVLFILTPLWSSLFIEEKSLVYSIIAKDTASDFDTENWPEINTSFKNQTIKNGTFIKILIVNNGDIPIKADDFEGVIEIVVNKPSLLLAHRIVEQFPDNLSIKTSITKTGVQISPILLNPKDRMVVELFGSDDFEITSVNGRVVGISSIKELEREQRSGLYLNDVEQIGPSRTSQVVLYKIYPIVLFLGLMLLYILSFMVMDIKKEVKKKPVIAFIYLVSLSGYILGLIISFSTLPVILEKFNFSTFASYILIVLMVFFSMVISTIFRFAMTPDNTPKDSKN